jgi:3-deoxy-manno-octulosonate cytidylyltransferase (CMP-KDO synthetase)
VKIVVCIPARYGSTRFAGKVLAKDTGKFLIQHTYEQACQAKLPEKVIIAADDERIVDAAKTFGAQCILTSPEHKSGTDRIAEAVKKLADSVERIGKVSSERYPPVLSEVEGLNADDIVINVQADEPEIDPANIDFLAEILIKNPDYPMATLAAPFETLEQINDPNIVKVVIAYSVQRTADRKKLNAKRYPLNADCGKAIYFSRAPVPYDRKKAGIGDAQQYLRHVGIYAYRKDFLMKITALPQTPLEKIEKLEQLRAIENGYEILVGTVKHTCDGIDTLEQYAEFVKRYKAKKSKIKMQKSK